MRFSHLLDFSDTAKPLNHAVVFVCFGFAVFSEMLQTPENSEFNKNQSRKLSGNNLTGNQNMGEYNTAAELFKPIFKKAFEILIIFANLQSYD